MSVNQHGLPPQRTPAPRVPPLSMHICRVLDVHSRQAVRAEFRYDRDAPLIVTLVFHVGSGPRVTWRIGRDLLYQGLYSMSGAASVQVWPADHDEWQSVWLKITSRDAAALFELPAPPLSEWLERTYALVPPGQETGGLDWDAFAASLLSGPEVPAN